MAIGKRLKKAREGVDREKLYPLALAESWDNVGLLVGSPDHTVTKVLLCIDYTDAVAKEGRRLVGVLVEWRRRQKLARQMLTRQESLARNYASARLRQCSHPSAMQRLAWPKLKYMHMITSSAPQPRKCIDVFARPMKSAFAQPKRCSENSTTTIPKAMPYVST